MVKSCQTVRLLLLELEIIGILTMMEKSCQTVWLLSQSKNLSKFSIWTIFQDFDHCTLAMVPWRLSYTTLVVFEVDPGNAHGDAKNAHTPDQTNTQ